MLEKLDQAHARFLELEAQLADPAVIHNKAKYQQIAKDYADLTPLIRKRKEYRYILSQIEQCRSLLDSNPDKDMKELAEAELEDWESRKSKTEDEIDLILNPPKGDEDRALIFEIRAGTGGEEASLFAGDLFRMYTKYADSKGWTVEMINSNESESGGYKEVIFSISGAGARKRLQWESGAHRVQRVPSTEASGRIHTSAATVAVLLEPQEVEIEIEPKDLKVDVFRSSGPGGQSVNTTDSAIRITHIPTGTVVTCQDERSQLKNKLKAMRVLRARLHDARIREEEEKAMSDRKLKVGSGDRSEKIRTYNFPDRRVTDHRIGFTTHKLPQVLDGDLDELTEALIEAHHKEAIR